MARYLLDTNHASPLVTLHHPLRQRALSAMQAGHEFAVCAPVVTEVWYGFSSVPRAPQNRTEWQKLRLRLHFYGLDEADAIDAAEIRLSMRRVGRQLLAMDSLIAMVALRYNCILLTTDRDFRAVPNLTYENWL